MPRIVPSASAALHCSQENINQCTLNATAAKSPPGDDTAAVSQNRTVASPAALPGQRLRARCLRAAATVITSAAFWMLHHRCSIHRAANAERQLKEQQLGAQERRRAVFDVDVDEASGLVSRRSAPPHRHGSIWRGIGSNLDWVVVGSGAVICASI